MRLDGALSTNLNRSVILSAGASGPFGDHSTLGTGIVSYWKMDEASGVRADSHASNDLSDVNTVGSGTAKIGDNAASFVKAATEKLNLASGLSELAATFSVSYWYNRDLNSLDGFMANGTDTTNFRIEHSLVGGGDAIAYVGGASVYGYTATGLLSIGTYAHVVVTYDGTDETAANRLHIWIDGDDKALTRSGAHPTTIPVGDEFQIGSNHTTNYADGLVDEVGIWSKLLTSDEISDLYNSGTGLTY